MMGEPTDDIQQAAGYKGAVPIIIVVGLVAASGASTERTTNSEIVVQEQQNMMPAYQWEKGSH